MAFPTHISFSPFLWYIYTLFKLLASVTVIIWSAFRVGLFSIVRGHNTYVVAGRNAWHTKPIQRLGRGLGANWWNLLLHSNYYINIFYCYNYKLYSAVPHLILAKNSEDSYAYTLWLKTLCKHCIGILTVHQHSSNLIFIIILCIHGCFFVTNIILHLTEHPETRKASKTIISVSCTKRNMSIPSKGG